MRNSESVDSKRSGFDDRPITALPATTPARVPSKYGAALTGSDWAGLPLRVGHIPESGVVEELSNHSDALLVWAGGPSEVDIHYLDPSGGSSPSRRVFVRSSGMIDLLPRGTRLHRVSWYGRPSICTSVNFPDACLAVLSSDLTAVLDPERGPEFGLVDAHVVDLVQRLGAQAQGEEDLGPLYVQSLSVTLASYVSARYGAGDARPAARRSPLSPSQRRAIEEFVESELSTSFGLIDLASVTGYCADHFARLFKQAYSQSPHQYVLSRRIERAKVLLRSSDLPIAAIALDCGFANQGHLTTAVKRRTGMTPGAYRRC